VSRRIGLGTRHRGDGPTNSNPFTALGLAPGADLSDDDVRAAWRRVAAATHPDRADGGDPERFAEAAAAYTALRTRFGRGETLADLKGPGRPHGASRADRPFSAAGPGLSIGRRVTAAPVVWISRLPARICRGRPTRLTLRCVATLAVSVAAALVAGAAPATPALIVGAVTWLIGTGRHDLAPFD
jgi:hypothetical protein